MMISIKINNLNLNVFILFIQVLYFNIVLINSQNSIGLRLPAAIATDAETVTKKNSVLNTLINLCIATAAEDFKKLIEEDPSTFVYLKFKYFNPDVNFYRIGVIKHTSPGVLDIGPVKLYIKDTFNRSFIKMMKLGGFEYKPARYFITNLDLQLKFHFNKTELVFDAKKLLESLLKSEYEIKENLKWNVSLDLIKNQNDETIKTIEFKDIDTGEVKKVTCHRCLKCEMFNSYIMDSIKLIKTYEIKQISFNFRLKELRSKNLIETGTKSIQQIKLDAFYGLVEAAGKQDRTVFEWRNKREIKGDVKIISVSFKPSTNKYPLQNCRGRFLIREKQKYRLIGFILKIDLPDVFLKSRFLYFKPHQKGFFTFDGKKQILNLQK